MKGTMGKTTPTRTTLQVGELEQRDVPAVAWSLTAGTLNVTIDSSTSGGYYSQRAGIDADSQYRVRLNDQVITKNGQPVRTSDIRAINVYGSNRDNFISVAGVTTNRFSGLNDRINLYGSGGNDSIIGSHVGCR